MCRCSLAILPVSLIVITLTTFCVTYIIAVTRKDVPAFLPYISDTGTTPPESCIFGFFLNLSSAIGFCTMFVRYKILRSLPPEVERDIRCLNLVSLFFGAVATFGICIVANFQEKSVVTAHTTGAILTFICGVVYLQLQSKVSYNLFPQYCDINTCRTRLIMGLLCLIFGVCLFVGRIVSAVQSEHHGNFIHWLPGEEGYAAHIAGTIGEWLTTVIFTLYFATYVQEFKAASINITAHLSPTYEGLGLQV